MKKIIFNTILLTTFSSCFAQIKISEADKKRAEKMDAMHFFVCMTSNNYYEKIARNNYYIFDTLNGELYYGKVKSGFFKGKITDIFKTDVYELQKQIPNFNDIPKDILEQLGKMGIDNCSLLNTYESAYFNVIFEKSRKDFDFTGKKIGFITGSNGKTKSNKTNYFRLERDRFNRNTTTNGGTLYIFDAEQKEKSGGYDAAIVYWSKVLVPINDVVIRLSGKQ
jgi:hypothetical protein